MSRAPDEGSDRPSVAPEQHELPRRRIYIAGEPWLVREVRAPAFDRRGGTHLVFESADVMRRVRDFPADWITLRDEDIYALSLRIRGDER